MKFKNRIDKQTLAAFSLLEMSVVIVIIGLLVGGVTVAQSYVKNAQLTAMMTEADYYFNAFSQFQTIYKAVPGDMPNASDSWSSANNGDGNGVISATGTSTPNTAELFYAFQDLALAGLIEGSFTGANNAVAGVTIPRSAFPKTALLFDHPNVLDGNVVNDSFYFDGLYFHVLRIAAQPQGSTALPSSPMITPKQALQIDSKFDDGKPGTGWVMTPKQSALGNCATSDTAASAAYNTNFGNAGCYLILRQH